MGSFSTSTVDMMTPPEYFYEGRGRRGWIPMSNAIDKHEMITNTTALLGLESMEFEALAGGSIHRGWPLKYAWCNSLHSSTGFLEFLRRLHAPDAAWSTIDAMRPLLLNTNALSNFNVSEECNSTVRVDHRHELCVGHRKRKQTMLCCVWQSHSKRRCSMHA